MIQINSIADFLRFTPAQQEEIVKALRTKDRLDAWLRALNGKKKKLPVATETPGWQRCKVCADTPGWIPVEEGRDDSDIHPSQIHKCIRNLWYACNGYADQLDEFIQPQLRMIFDMGHNWHHIIQSYGKRGAWGEGPYIAEPEIDPDAVDTSGQPVLPLAARLWIKGHADALLPQYFCPAVPGVGDVLIKVVHEYKTISSGGYSKLNRPKPEHKWQAMIYAAVFDAPIVVFIYTNKDNCQMADFPVAFDGRLWQEIEAKILDVQRWSDARTPPDFAISAATKNPSECRECGFRKICNPPVKG